MHLFFLWQYVLFDLKVRLYRRAAWPLNGREEYVAEQRVIPGRFIIQLLVYYYS
jgi:hypothetical protein